MPRYGVSFLSSFAANLLAGYLAGMPEAVERGAVFHFLGGQGELLLDRGRHIARGRGAAARDRGRLCRLMHGRAQPFA
jgi:hypothetical protein